MRVHRVLPVGVCVLLAAAVVFAGSNPVAVSPGDASKLVLIGDACPTFSWGQVDGAKGYELVVYRVGDESTDSEPPLSQHIPGSALSWTPSLDLCLERGQYAWSVRAVTKNAASEWSPPSLFEVAASPSVAEVLTVLQSYLDAGGSIEELMDLGLAGARQPPSVAVGAPVPRTTSPPPVAQATPDPTPVLNALATDTSNYAAMFEYDDSAGTRYSVGLGFDDLALSVFGHALFNAGDHRFVGRLIIPKVGLSGSDASGADTYPEVYQILDKRGCDAERRGAIQIMKPSAAAGQDSLCFCGLVTNDYYWWCFNP